MKVRQTFKTEVKEDERGRKIVSMMEMKKEKDRGLERERRREHKRAKQRERQGERLRSLKSRDYGSVSFSLFGVGKGVEDAWVCAFKCAMVIERVCVWV